LLYGVTISKFYLRQSPGDVTGMLHGGLEGRRVTFFHIVVQCMSEAQVIAFFFMEGWAGLLFAMMCLSSQFQKLYTAPGSEPTSLQHSPCPSHGGKNQRSTDVFRQRTVQCLMVGYYTNGGPSMLETLLLYMMSNLPSKSFSISPTISWLLIGAPY
jgi:hypothetical protein